MSSIKDIVMLGRIHTAASTTAGMLFAYFVAGGSLISWMSLLIFLFALGVHYVGFAQNDVADFKVDKNDPARQHFSLVSGRVSFENAKYITIYLAIVTLMLGILLAKFALLPMTFLALGMVCGIAYNQCRKYRIYLLWAMPLSSVFLLCFAYSLASSKFGLAFYLMSVIAFFLMLFMTTISNHIRDFTSDKVCILTKLGAKVTQLDNKMFFDGGMNTTAYAGLLRMGLIIPCCLVVSWFKPPIIGIALFTVFWLAVFFTTFWLIGVGEYNRRVKECAAAEISAYLMMVWAFSGIYGLNIALFLTLFPMLFWVIANYYLWGTLLVPRT